ncbi:MAG: DUF3332 family protein [Gemmatimonadaceae bacterium]|nr:DUF3332 family protein [Gemmatimonadaceae bacterium]
MRHVSMRRAVVAGILLTTVASNTACFGSFPLTRKFYAFNKGISSDKFVQELFFLATAVLVPVYGVAALIDVVILNSMEFWTGEPALASGPETKTKTLVRGDVTVKQTMTRLASGARTMVLEETVAGQFRSRTIMHQAAGAKVVTAETEFADGRKETRTLSADEAGALTIATAGRAPRTLTASEVDAAAARVQQLQASALAAR